MEVRAITMTKVEDWLEIPMQNLLWPSRERRLRGFREETQRKENCEMHDV